MNSHNTYMVFRNEKYPGVKSPFLVSQEYATNAYLTLLFVLLIVLYFRMLQGAPLLLPGLAGVFLITFFSNIYAIVRMKKVYTETGFKEDQFYLRNVYDVIRNKTGLWFDLQYATPKREGTVLWVHYFGRPIPLRLQEWHDPQGILDGFSGRLKNDDDHGGHSRGNVSIA
jgi:hypothetical protein